MLPERTATLEALRQMQTAGDTTPPQKDAPDRDMPDGFWDDADIRLPRPKAALNLRVDPDNLELFKEGGAKGTQTRIHAVLRAYADAKRG